MEVGGSVVGLGVAGVFTSINFVWGAYAALIVLLLAGGLTVFRRLREPPSTGLPFWSGVRKANFKTFFYDTRANVGFTRVLGARFLFFLGFVSIQRFLRNFLSDVFNLSSPEAWAAGILSWRRSSGSRARCWRAASSTSWGEGRWRSSPPWWPRSTSSPSPSSPTST